jgi:ABC-type phosphate/phosphonate transport system substrate-binding protein
MRAIRQLSGVSLTVLIAAGCQTTERLDSPLFPTARFTVLAEYYKIGSYLDFRVALSKELGRRRSVGIDLAITPGDIPLRMTFGTVDFAFLPTRHLHEVWNPELSRLLVSIADEDNTKYEKGLFVARADSSIKSLTDVSDRTIAFGPKYQAVTHLSAVHALRKAGLSMEDVKSSVNQWWAFGFPLDLLMKGEAEVAIISESDYEAIDPESEERTATTIVGRTTPILRHVIVVRKEVDTEIADAVSRWLVGKASQDPKILKAMSISGFQEITDNDRAMLHDLIELSKEISG